MQIILLKMQNVLSLNFFFFSLCNTRPYAQNCLYCLCDVSFFRVSLDYSSQGAVTELTRMQIMMKLIVNKLSEKILNSAVPSLILKGIYNIIC